MSPAVKENKTWFAGNYDKLALILALVGLLVSSMLLVLSTNAEKSSLNQFNTGGVTLGNVVTEISLEQKQARVDAVKNPVSSINTRAKNTNDMLVSELRVISINDKDLPVPIPYDALTCWATGAEQPTIPTNRDSDIDGMLDTFEEEYGFDPLNAEDALADTDGDGFSNVEEASAGTSPIDGTIFPDLTAKLRLAKAVKDPFRLVFKGVNTLADGSYKFQFNDRVTRQSYFARLGDDVLDYKISRFDPDATQGPTVTITRDGQKIPLVKGKLLGENEVLAYMIFLLDGTKYRVKVGEEIQLRSQSYKVIDIRPKTVSIRNLGSEEVSLIGQLTRDEYQSMVEKSKQDESTDSGLVPASSGQGE